MYSINVIDFTTIITIKEIKSIPNTITTNTKLNSSSLNRFFFIKLLKLFLKNQINKSLEIRFKNEFMLVIKNQILDVF